MTPLRYHCIIYCTKCFPSSLWYTFTVQPFSTKVPNAVNLISYDLPEYRMASEQHVINDQLSLRLLQPLVKCRCQILHACK